MLVGPLARARVGGLHLVGVGVRLRVRVRVRVRVGGLHPPRRPRVVRVLVEGLVGAAAHEVVRTHLVRYVSRRVEYTFQGGPFRGGLG